MEGLIDAFADAVAGRIADRRTVPGPRLLSVAQAAEYLGRTLDAVKHLIAEGSLPVVRSDRRVFLDRLDLDRWIEEQKEQAIYRPTYRKPNGTVVQWAVWWVKYYRNGVPIRESTKTDDWEDANRFLKRRNGEVVTGKFRRTGPERVRMRSLFEAVEDDYKDNQRKSLRDVQIRLKKHRLPAFGDVRAADFGTWHIKQYIARRRREEAPNSTINREFAIVSRGFHLAHRMEDWLKQPASGKVAGKVDHLRVN